MDGDLLAGNAGNMTPQVPLHHHPEIPFLFARHATRDDNMRRKRNDAILCRTSEWTTRGDIDEAESRGEIWKMRKRVLYCIDEG